MSEMEKQIKGDSSRAQGQKLAQYNNFVSTKQANKVTLDKSMLEVPVNSVNVSGIGQGRDRNSPKKDLQLVDK